MDTLPEDTHRVSFRRGYRLCLFFLCRNRYTEPLGQIFDKKVFLKKDDLFFVFQFVDILNISQIQ